MADEALYAWSMVAQNWSDDSYYVWPDSTTYPVTVVASVKDDAIKEGARLLGSPGRGRHWRFVNIKAKDIRLLSEEEKAKL